MKAVFEKVNIGIGLSFNVKKFTVAEFDAPWHFHPELELTYIMKSKGTRFVGDSVQDFSENDLVLLGPNLPHLWQNPAHHESGSQAIVIHFAEQFLNTDLKTIPEFERIYQLLQASRTGLWFGGETAFEAGREMNRMISLPPYARLIAFLNLLHRLAGTSDYRPLASEGYVHQSSAKEAEQLAVVFEFVRQHFQAPVRLEEVANLIHLTPPAFCRFFKKRVRRTFFEFLNEFRIGRACRLLLETNLKITDIAYRSGFSNIAHFNKQFKSITGHNPASYRRQHAGS